MTTERKAFEAWHNNEFGWNNFSDMQWQKRLRAWKASRKVALEEAAARVPMTESEIHTAVKSVGLDWHRGFAGEDNRYSDLVRVVEVRHGITGEAK